MNQKIDSPDEFTQSLVASVLKRCKYDLGSSEKDELTGLMAGNWKYRRLGNIESDPNIQTIKDCIQTIMKCDQQTGETPSGSLQGLPFGVGLSDNMDGLIITLKATITTMLKKYN